jgi:NAD(P)-dependent dehydrogenase (short-subunit alcohol dehydrogenase family)
MNKQQKSISPWSLERLPKLNGKTIVITGANSGLGFEAARVFARAGAHLVLACRSEAKTREAIGRIHTETPGAAVEFMELDLASLASVRAFAARANERLARIDVLCNNAGVMTVPYKKYATTKDGFEMHFGINHLGHFALTGLMLDKLIASAPARIVTVSSYAHRLGGKMVFEDLQGRRNFANAYANSKLANLLFTYELERRLRGRNLEVKAVACHPGFARSNLFTTGPRMAQSKPAWWMKLLLLTAQPTAMGAMNEIYAAVGSDIEGGDYIGPSGFFEAVGLPKKVQSNRRSLNEADARQLWECSEELSGVRFLD